jgi:CheY-like chemotaxis protein
MALVPGEQRATLLIVDDDSVYTHLVSRQLERTPFQGEVVTLHNGAQALDYLYGCGQYAGHRQAQPRVILLDLNMPGMDGYQVLRVLKQDSALREIPVIILTSVDTPESMQYCYALGCDIYLVKPLERGALPNMIRSLVRFLGNGGYLPLSAPAGNWWQPGTGVAQLSSPLLPHEHARPTR